MRTFRLFQWAVTLLLFSAGAWAQSPSIHIKSARFAQPLVERWAVEYEKSHPGVSITVSSEPATEADLHFIVSNEADPSVIAAARYALLPITNEENPVLNELSKKKLNEKRLEEFFFETGLSRTGSSSGEVAYNVTIYSGNIPGSSADLFANHFGYDAADIRGRRISGDDIFLINAVQKDPNGVTFNNLSYIFDMETRRLKPGLALLPLDVKRGQAEILESADVDQAIALLEEERIALIPVEHVGFVHESGNTVAREFLSWVLTEGQQFNQAHGFLKVEDEPRYTASF